MSPRKKILLFSEGVTLSQVVRLVTLGRALDPREYDVTFACSSFDPLIFEGTTFRRVLVHSLDPKVVSRTVTQGRRLYDKRTLMTQIAEDLEVFEAVRPDLVVGDFRWSLAVSAPVFGVPHAALINAYWSPHAERDAFPVPDHPIVRILGERLTARYFPEALPRVFEHFAAPLNAARKAHGLPPVGSLLEVLTHGDFVLYADPEELIPTPGAPATHEHIGFVPWAPEGPLPSFWDELPNDRPVVYATLGSSGNVDRLPLLIEALGGLPVTAVVATAGRKSLGTLPGNVHAADYLPGDLAARRSALVISNGGSSTSYQALAEGVPVIGVASNLDQYLAMTAIESSGAGLLVPSRTATVDSLRKAAATMLASSTHGPSAKKVRDLILRTSAVDRFRAFVARVTSEAASTKEPRQGNLESPRRAIATAVLAALVATGGWNAADAHAESKAKPAPKSGEIRFAARVPNGKGTVVCALFRESGWLKKPVRVANAPLFSGEATCVFPGTVEGSYGIVAFHDENGNGDIDTNFIGIPTEDWCTSRNAKAIFGPPSFGDARFLSKAGTVRLGCTM